MADVNGFWMDRMPVTNRQFQRFVKATGHVTLAERPPDPRLYPNAQTRQLVPASIVFVPPPGPIADGDHHSWWQFVPGADWRHPEGPGSSIRHRDQHPVVHVAWDDALAYARWAGKQLPSETEWERAAWGGQSGCEFAWGDALHPRGVPVANTFQGDFPHHNSRLDGYERTSPVGAFPENGFGLLDMIGNVWEWTDSWYAVHDPCSGSPARNRAKDACCGQTSEATDLARLASIDPSSQHGMIPRKVVKGGSFLCAPGYCRRYRPAARMAQGIDTSTCHMGFRCIVRPDCSGAGE
jgi:formylglycine-generating enzyme required for sulfatase activity